MNHFHKNIKGWFTWPTLYKDMVIKFPSGSIFVEVGVFRGQSLSHLIVEMMNAGKTYTVIAVDSFVQSGSSLEIFNANIDSIKDKVDVIVGNSEDVANRFENKTLDFVFIDANHEYESVKKDIIAWMPKVKKGGILAGHDYPGYLGVKQAVDELLGDKIDKKYIAEFCWLITI